MGMLQHLIIEPMQYRQAALGWSRFWQICDERTNGAFDNGYRRLARIRQPPVTLPQTALMTAQEIAGVVSVERDGFAGLPLRLSPDDLADIRRFMFSTPAYGLDPGRDIRVREDNIPCDEGRYTWRTADVIALPVVQNLIFTGPYCAIAQAYLGCRPTLVTITLWLNPPFPPRQYGANNYHYDNAGPGFLKLFFLLTDMGPGTGAHYFIKGSHCPRKPPQVARSSSTRMQRFSLSTTGARNWWSAARPVRSSPRIRRDFIAAVTSPNAIGHSCSWSSPLLTRQLRRILDRQYSPIPIAGLNQGMAAITRKFFVRGS